MLPVHIVISMGIELAKSLPGLTGRSLKLLPGHIVTGKGIELAKLLPGLIMSAAGGSGGLQPFSSSPPLFS